MKNKLGLGNPFEKRIILIVIALIVIVMVLLGITFIK